MNSQHNNTDGNISTQPLKDRQRRKTRIVSKLDIKTFLQLAAPRGLIEGLPPLLPSIALTGHDSNQPSYLK
jgi:hypothetical protein